MYRNHASTIRKRRALAIVGLMVAAQGLLSDGLILPALADSNEVFDPLTSPVPELPPPATSEQIGRVKELQKRVFGEDKSIADDFAARRCLARLEAFVLGREQTGDLSVRLANLNAVLDGSATAAAVNKNPLVGGQTAAAASDDEKEKEKEKEKQKAPTFAPGSPSIVPLAAPAAGAGQAANASTDPTKTLHGRVDTLAAAYNAIGLHLEKNALPTPVTVKVTGLARRAGVMDNDQLLHAEVGIDTISLALERSGHRFMLELPLSDKPKALVASATDRGSFNPKTIKGAIATALPGSNYVPLGGEAGKIADWNLLKKYNIAILLDTSGSMNMSVNTGIFGHSSYNRPVFGGSDSKFSWAKDQIYSLATEARSLSGSAFDFGVFDSGAQIYANCNPEQVLQIMSSKTAGGGTNLSGALQSCIESRYQKAADKPFLIVVVTDAMINNAGELESMMVRAAQQAKRPYDIRVVFLQIGSEKGGQDLVDFLDAQPVADGAPYDICSSVNWNELSQVGLRSGLLEAMSKPADSGVITDPLKVAAFARLKTNGRGIFPSASLGVPFGNQMHGLPVGSPPTLGSGGGLYPPGSLRP